MQLHAVTVNKGTDRQLYNSCICLMCNSFGTLEEHVRSLNLTFFFNGLWILVDDTSFYLPGEW